MYQLVTNKQSHNKSLMLASIKNVQNKYSKKFFFQDWLQRRSEWSRQILMPQNWQTPFDYEIWSLSLLLGQFYLWILHFLLLRLASYLLATFDFGTGASNAAPRNIWNKPFKLRRLTCWKHNWFASYQVNSKVWCLRNFFWFLMHQIVFQWT